MWERIEDLNTQRLKQEDIYDTAIMDYSKAETLPLVMKMQSDLPRELRDLIYQFYWDEVEVENARAAEPCQGSLLAGTIDAGSSPRCDHPSHFLEHCLNWRSTNHLTRPEFVGIDIAREAASSYYRTITMVIEAGHIKTTLNKDIFGLGLVPGDHVRSIVLNIRETIGSVETDGYGRKSINMLVVWDKDGENVLVKDLEALSSIRVKRGLDLQVRVADSTLDSAIGGGILFFHPFYRSLKAAGAHVVVSYTQSKRKMRAYVEDEFGDDDTVDSDALAEYDDDDDADDWDGFDNEVDEDASY
jgi:hypothetical protein